MREHMQILATTFLLLSSVPGVCLGGELLSDPTRPYSASESRVAASPRFEVNAIIVSSERRIAIVNGRRVGVGASVRGATVISIEKDYVILEKDGERITAGLNDTVSRQ